MQPNLKYYFPAYTEHHRNITGYDFQTHIYGHTSFCYNTLLDVFNYIDSEFNDLAFITLMPK